MVAVFGSRLEALPCPTCDGTREVPFRKCNHSGNCPCGPGYMACPDCLRTRGYQTCTICGDQPAIAPDADGDPSCQFCLAAEADEARGVA